MKLSLAKGLGIVSKIMSILDTITFGSKYFEIGTTLRQAELINGILTNAEVWYGITKSQLEELEEVDKLLLRRILNAPISTSVESLYLELGLIPIHIIVKARRVKFLHYPTRLSESEMLFKVFHAQWKYPVKNDWTITVKQDLKDLKIDSSLEEIKKKTDWTFNRLVKVKTKDYALKYLLELKEKHSKMDSLQYHELKIQNYLKDTNIPVKEAQIVFRYRTRMAKFKENFKNYYNGNECPFCLVHSDTQAHYVQCSVVKENIEISGDYKEIFTDEISREISKTLFRVTQFRESMKMSPEGGPIVHLMMLRADAARICICLN